MTPVDLVAAVTEVLADGGVAATGADDSFDTATIDVAVADWVAAATAVRDDPRLAGQVFDWLSAYDDLDAGLAVVVRVWSLTRRAGILLRTRVPRANGGLPTLTAVWAGADWHERETFEMFGVDFAGHPNLVPLLLPDGFDGQPLRKEFVLASRVAKAWPGEVEPADRGSDPSDPSGASDQSDATAATARSRRRPLRPPGVPEPGSWGTES